MKRIKYLVLFCMLAALLLPLQSFASQKENVPYLTCAHYEISVYFVSEGHTQSAQASAIFAISKAKSYAQTNATPILWRNTKANSEKAQHYSPASKSAQPWQHRKQRFDTKPNNKAYDTKTRQRQNPKHTKQKTPLPKPTQYFKNLQSQQTQPKQLPRLHQ